MPLTWLCVCPQGDSSLFGKAQLLGICCSGDCEVPCGSLDDVVSLVRMLVWQASKRLLVQWTSSQFLFSTRHKAFRTVDQPVFIIMCKPVNVLLLLLKPSSIAEHVRCNAVTCIFKPRECAKHQAFLQPNSSQIHQ